MSQAALLTAEKMARGETEYQGKLLEDLERETQYKILMPRMLSGKMVGKFFIVLITIYKKFFSPILGSNCRFQPTCSTYTIVAIKRFGAFHGIILGFKRIIHFYNLYFLFQKIF